MMRKPAICLAICVIFAVIGCGNAAITTKSKPAETFGAWPNPTGNPIGGGKGYHQIVSRSHFKVSTAQGLLAALKKAGKGQVVYVDDGAEIDLTGKQKIVIPGGVILASGRGNAKGGKVSKGALLFTKQQNASPLFQVGGPGVRITGLRIRGPDPERRTALLQGLHKQGKYYTIPTSDGIQSKHPNLEVDNCEVSAWGHAAIYLMKGAANAHVHHNYIHHNQRSGLGYGVSINQATALIEGNLFDFCRHAIAGTGRPGEVYEARYNIYMAHANGHIFDMHGGGDRGDGTNIAGTRINIHHNTVINTDWPAAIIRGRPQQPSEIHHNWFIHIKEPWANKQNIGWCVMQLGGEGNLKVYKNHYGPK
ncbi:MAG: hypothetical protein QF662_08815, partial [Phycisphaerae bacterium]|nr:hypothetical protein [Phycisphaerae bacterium]